jgi:hypothetical protein
VLGARANTTMADLVPRRKESIAFTSQDQRMAVLDLSRPGHPPFLLAGSAYWVWELMDGSRSVLDMADELMADVDDVLECIRELVDLGLAILEITA